MSHHYMEGTETTQQILPSRTRFDGVPYVGCAVTISVGSDSYPGTVTRLSDKKVRYEGLDLPTWVEIQDCLYRRTDRNGLSENQEYVYYQSSTPFDRVRRYSWRPGRNNYVQVGTRSDSSGASPPLFGYRRAYRDPSF